MGQTGHEIERSRYILPDAETEPDQPDFGFPAGLVSPRNTPVTQSGGDDPPIGLSPSSLFPESSSSRTFQAFLDRYTQMRAHFAALPRYVLTQRLFSGHSRFSPDTPPASSSFLSRLDREIVATLLTKHLGLSDDSPVCADATEETQVKNLYTLALLGTMHDADSPQSIVRNILGEDTLRSWNTDLIQSVCKEFLSAVESGGDSDETLSRLFQVFRLLEYWPHSLFLPEEKLASVSGPVGNVFRALSRASEFSGSFSTTYSEWTRKMFAEEVSTMLSSYQSSRRVSRDLMGLFSRALSLHYAHSPHALSPSQLTQIQNILGRARVQAILDAHSVTGDISPDRNDTTTYEARVLDAIEHHVLGSADEHFPDTTRSDADIETLRDAFSRMGKHERFLDILYRALCASRSSSSSSPKDSSAIRLAFRLLLGSIGKDPEAIAQYLPANIFRDDYTAHFSTKTPVPSGALPISYSYLQELTQQAEEWVEKISGKMNGVSTRQTGTFIARSLKESMIWDFLDCTQFLNTLQSLRNANFGFAQSTAWRDIAKYRAQIHWSSFLSREEAVAQMFMMLADALLRPQHPSSDPFPRDVVSFLLSRVLPDALIRPARRTSRNIQHYTSSVSPLSLPDSDRKRFYDSGVFRTLGAWGVSSDFLHEFISPSDRTRSFSRLLTRGEFLVLLAANSDPPLFLSRAEAILRRLIPDTPPDSLPVSTLSSFLPDDLKELLTTLRALGTLTIAEVKGRLSIWSDMSHRALSNGADTLSSGETEDLITAVFSPPSADYPPSSVSDHAGHASDQLIAPILVRQIEREIASFSNQMLCSAIQCGIDAEMQLHQFSGEESKRDELTYLAAKGRAARELIITKNIKQVYKKVWKLFFRRGEKRYLEGFDDFVQEGRKGLERASFTYDSTKGDFSLYACYWINHYLYRLISKERGLSVTISDLTPEDGDEEEMQDFLIQRSLRREGALLPSPEDIVFQAQEEEEQYSAKKEQIRTMLGTLDESDRFSLLLSFGFVPNIPALSQKHVASLLGVTRQAVSHAQTKIRRELAERFSPHSD